MKLENISAIATAMGSSGCAIIRLSGDSPLTVAKKMFKPSNKTAVENFEPYKMYAGEIVTDNFVDYGMCVYFKSPKSFTGEDVVEFHCHGGVAITRGVLSQTLKCGCRLADRGEFTRRAFLNGKLSLSSCEGLIDMINSESEGEIKAGYYLYRENLKKQIENCQDRITNVLAEIDASIDFPEEGLEFNTTLSVKNTLLSIKEEVQKLVASYKTGSKIKSGVSVAIVGKPNTGKSSLLNRLLNSEKAIVSDVEGTTRDVVEGTIEINGVKFNLSDTAGMHNSDNKIEELGIEIAKRVSNASDINLLILDSTRPLDEKDMAVIAQLKDKEKIVVFNKIDEGKKLDLCEIDVCVSATTGENIQELKTMLFERAIGKGIDFNGDYLIEERHFNALTRAVNSINDALLSMENELSLDLITIDIGQCWSYLGEISGKTCSEEIISEIFAKFCVGK